MNRSTFGLAWTYSSYRKCQSIQKCTVDYGICKSRTIRTSIRLHLLASWTEVVDTTNTWWITVVVWVGQSTFGFLWIRMNFIILSPVIINTECSTADYDIFKSRSISISIRMHLFVLSRVIINIINKRWITVFVWVDQLTFGLACIIYSTYISAVIISTTIHGGSLFFAWIGQSNNQ